MFPPQLQEVFIRMTEFAIRPDTNYQTTGYPVHNCVAVLLVDG